MAGMTQKVLTQLYFHCHYQKQGKGFKVTNIKSDLLTMDIQFVVELLYMTLFYFPSENSSPLCYAMVKVLNFKKSGKFLGYQLPEMPPWLAPSRKF